MTASASEERLPAAAWAPVTKFVAPTHRAGVVLDAGRVEGLATRIDEHPVTLVVAPGGSGKTTVVGAALHAGPRPVGWLRLAPTDDDAITLVELVALAVERVAPAACPTVRSVLAAGSVLPPHHLVGVLVNDLAEVGPLVVVLDDLHHLQDPTALAVLSGMVDHLPDEVRLVATSRRMPDMPLTRHRATGRIAVVGPDDLALTDAEARELLSRSGVDPSVRDRVVASAGGWVTGLLLGALVDADGLASGDLLGDYLEEEVLAHESEEVRRFLRSVAILDELDPETCGAVAATDRAGELLDDLRGRLGVLVADHGGTLRLHDLLRDHLLAEWRRNAPEEERRELHLRAAEHTTGSRRIEHLLEAADHDRVADELDVMVRQWSRSPGAERLLSRWIDRLPEPVRAAHPWLDLTIAASAANRLDTQSAVPLLESVLERAVDADYELRVMAQRSLALVTHDEAHFGALARLASDKRWHDLTVTTRVEWSIASAWPQLMLGNPDGVRTGFERAISCLRDERELAAAETLALHIGAPMAVWPGSLSEIRTALRWMGDHFGEASGIVRLGVDCQLGLVDALTGIGREAVTYSPAEREVIEHFPFWALSDLLVELYRVRAAGDHASVIELGGAGLEREGAIGQVALLLTPMMAASMRESRRPEEIDGLLDRLDGWVGGPPGPGAVHGSRDLVLAERTWAQGRSAEAVGAFRSAHERWSSTTYAIQLDPLAEAAVCLAEAGRAAEATDLLAGRVRELVGRLDAAGRVALGGPALVPLLERAIGTVPSVRAVLDVLGRRSSPSPRAVPGSPEILTVREVEVLEQLATGAGNAEIAARLHVSVNTVKTHVQRVLTKVGATNRSEAVARARELRLL